MEAVITRAKPVALKVVKTVAVTVGFALAYYLIAEANPTLAKSITEPFGFTIRLSQLLRAFVFPLGAVVPVGTFIGSVGFNASVGDLPFVPLANLGIGMGVVLASRAWGRSAVKDVSLLALYGLLTGLVVALKLTGWAMLAAPEAWKPLLSGAVALKVGVHTATYLAGYPVVRGFERLMRRG